MSSLQNNYQDQIDFIHIDWDDDDSRPVIEYFAVFRRSTYILIAPDGTVLWQLVGPLNEAVAEGEILKALEAYPSN